MSISSMANAAMTRRTDFGGPGVPTGIREIAFAAGAPPAPSVRPPSPPAQPRVTGRMPIPPAQPTGAAATAPPAAPAAAVGTASAALQVITTYIPTEILTLYVAVIGAIRATKADEIALTARGWTVFWVFLVGSPIAVWIIYAAKVRAAGKPLPVALGSWPMWEMTAATIAYAAWAFALPESPLAQTDASRPLAPVVVLVASTVLGLLAPVVQQPIKP
jgi:hypothetical protein